MNNLVFKLSSVFLLYGGSLFCQTGINQHDGFFLRMLYGVGYAKLVEKDVIGSDVKISGLAQALRFQIGGSVSQNLIIYGEFGGVNHENPKMEWIGQSGSGSEVAASLFDFGLGITYYLIPANIYFSLSTLTSQVELDYNNIKSKSEFKFETFNGINAMIGKEWWVGDEWALGVSLYGYYSTMKDNRNVEGIKHDYTIHNFSVGVMFSATYD